METATTLASDQPTTYSVENRRQDLKIRLSKSVRNAVDKACLNTEEIELLDRHLELTQRLIEDTTCDIITEALRQFSDNPTENAPRQSNYENCRTQVRHYGLVHEIFEPATGQILEIASGQDGVIVDYAKTKAPDLVRSIVLCFKVWILKIGEELKKNEP